MSGKKKILMLFVGDGARDSGDGLDVGRLAEVLRARGGEVEEQVLGADPTAVLDCLQDGVLPLVFDRDRAGRR
ncbi:MAG: hypothetical protein LC646_04940 [Xanthomonadaceae bacterium]|nr:hypothetical protein [Xanthomonadaceae bacterium]